MADKTLRIVIIEDQREMRDGLSMLLGGTPGFVCSGAYATMEEALSALRDSAAHGALPDVVLVDLGLPGMSGIEGIGRIRAVHPSLPAVVLSAFDDDDRVFRAVCAGACGYLLKKTPPAQLLAGLTEVVDGGAPMSPEIARKVLDLFRVTRPPESSPQSLTPHETRVLRLIVGGHNYKTAAEELGVSMHAVSFHMRNIYEKLEVHSKSEAVAKALRSGLVR